MIATIVSTPVAVLAVFVVSCKTATAFFKAKTRKARIARMTTEKLDRIAS